MDEGKDCTGIEAILPPHEVEKLPEPHRRIAKAFVLMTNDYPLDGDAKSERGSRSYANETMAIDDPKYHKSEHWDQFTSAFIASLLKPEFWRDFRNNGLNGGMESKTTIHLSKEGIRKGSVFRNYAERLGYDIGAEYHSLTNEERLLTDKKSKEGIRAEYDWLAAQVGGERMAQFFDIDIGRPVYCPENGHHLNTIDLRNAYYSCRVFDLVDMANIEPRVIAEIGGGFGGHAGNLKQRYKGATLVLLDLPETLTIQMYYLRQRFPNATCLDILDIRKNPDCLKNLSGIDFVFLPGWEIVRLPNDTIDVWSNTESFAEMFRPISNGYVKEASRTARVHGVFYCHNRYAKRSSGTPYRYKDLPFDDRWQLAFGRVGLKRSNYEVGLIRAAQPVTHPFARWRRQLPPYDMSDVMDQARRAIEMITRIIIGDGQISANPGVRGFVYLSIKRTRICLGKARNKLRQMTVKSS